MIDAPDFAADLRKVADFYDAHPDFPLPTTPLTIDISVKAAEMKAAARSVPRFDKTSGTYFFALNYKFGGITLDLFTNRDNICIRRVVGTKMVETEVVEKTRTEQKEVEIVEWDCPTLLNGSNPQGELLTEFKLSQ